MAASEATDLVATLAKGWDIII